MIHVAGKVDPMSDIEVINTELALADLDTVEKAVHAQQQAGQDPATRMRSRSDGAAGEECAPRWIRASPRAA